MHTAVSSVQHRIQVSGDARFLTSGQVRERYSCSDMWIYRHMAAQIEEWERQRAKLASN
jgi:hypothetical protein